MSTQNPEIVCHGLWVRQGDQIVAAPPADVQLANGYPNWSAKGKANQGRRITLMAEQRTYTVGESVRVIHVLEVLSDQIVLDMMGPKTVYGEYYDGKLGTPAAPSDDVAFVAAVANGRRKKGPGLDFNFDMTMPKFDTPGLHRIVWSVAGLESNLLEVMVK